MHVAMNATVRDLLEAGVHFGHQTSRWNPKMKKFIFEQRNGIHIIDLRQTMQYLSRAYNFIKETAARGHKILFVGTKKQAKEIIREEATRCGMYYVNERWLGGLLTNFVTIRKSSEHYKHIQSMIDDGSIDKMPGKEASSLRREWTKLHRNLDGIKNMPELPTAIFIVDPKREGIAVREARKKGLTVVAIADTNCDPDLIDYPIPGNDDAVRTIKLLASLVADAVLEGKKEIIVIPQAVPVAAQIPAAGAVEAHKPVKKTSAPTHKAKPGLAKASGGVAKKKDVKVLHKSGEPVPTRDAVK